jgi:ABC-2 type transport system permease protein
MSFAIFLTAQASVTALEFAAIVILLDVVPDLGGWTAREVAFLYGLATVPFALSDVVVSPVERLSHHVREGTFDRLLLRPVPSLVQICANEFELRRAGKLLPNLAVLVWAVGSVDVAWSAATMARLALALAGGTVIYSALWVLSAASSFWLVAAQEATNSLTYGGEFANEYPLHLYRGWIRAVLGWGVPLAFVAYVPAVRILGAPNPLGLPDWLYLLTVPVAAALCGVAMLVWRLGVRHYQGTGS